MNVEIWGIYPPPIGGVTIHVFRLIHSIHKIDSRIILRNFGKTNPNILYVFNVKNRIYEFLKLLFSKNKVIHLQSNNFFLFLILILFGWRHKLGITIHNKYLVDEKSKLKFIIIRYFLKKVKFIIMNDPVYKFCLSNKFGIDSQKIFIIPAFIPPLPIEEKGLKQIIIDFKTRHSFLLSANAFKLRKDASGIDVYGLDLLIKLIKTLRDKDIDAGLIFCLPMIGDESYYNHCLLEIQNNEISDHILFVQEELTNGFEIWKLSDLFIRPTNTDIEGLSVKEALYEGTPVIASDVCDRPKESILFKNRNFDDLLDKVYYVYHHRDEVHKNIMHYTENSVSKILNIYKNIK